MSFDPFMYGWPWMGAGGAVVLLILLFKTDLFRSGSQSRWKDLVWLAWLQVPVYLVHQFEEYSLHMENGQYAIVSTFYSADGPMGAFPDMALPLAHFPLMNITFVWIALPIAASLAKRNPVIGLSGYGFIIVNACVHLAGVAFMGMPPLQNPGFFTGTFIFLPLVIWMIYVCRKSGVMSGKAIAVTLFSGVLGHIGLGSCYAFAIMQMPYGTLLADIVVSFLPMMAAWVLCKIFKVRFES